MGTAGRGRRLPENLLSKARKIDREIARSNCILITGSCMGTPHEAVIGAGQAGGITIGFSPAANLKEHLEPPISYPRPAKNCILIFTGAGKEGRIVPMLRTCDGVIFIAGSIGSLVEFSMAYHMGKVIGVLEKVGGISEKFRDLARAIQKDTGAVLVSDCDPKKLVKKVIEELTKKG